MRRHEQRLVCTTDLLLLTPGTQLKMKIQMMRKMMEKLEQTRVSVERNE